MEINSVRPRPYGLSFEEATFYEKETGLCLMVDDANTREEFNGTIEYRYEFNNVDDSIFEEPDINLYEITEEVLY